jgi:tetratricopeptide (TPR) repeat protein
MRCIQVLSGLALTRLLQPCLQPVASGVCAAQSERILPPHTYRYLTRALHQANARTWTVIRIVLAGKSLTDRLARHCRAGQEGTLVHPVRALLDALDFNFPDVSPLSRMTSARALSKALHNGILTGGTLDVQHILVQATRWNESGTGETGSEIEWIALARLCEHLTEAGHPQLRPVFHLRNPLQDSLLVSLMAQILRHTFEADPDQSSDLAVYTAEDSREAGAEVLQVADLLDYHRADLETLLDQLDCVEEAGTPSTSTSAQTVLDELGLAPTSPDAYHRAVTQFTEAVPADTDVVTAFVRRAEANRIKGDYQQALADYDAALARAPDNAQAYFNRGLLHWTIGQHDAAIADYTAALRLDPQNAIAWNNRGNALAARGDRMAALADFTEALRLAPDYSWAYHNRGDLHVSNGDHDLALLDYTQGLRIDPLSPLTYIRRGDVYRSKGELERALADYGNALRLDPFNIAGHISRGVTYRLQGEHERALGDLEQARRLDLRNPAVLYQRALTYRTRGDLRQALADFDEAVQLDPANAELLHERGHTHQLLGNYAEALGDYGETIRLVPAHARAFNSRGALHGRRGEYEQALADFSTAIALKPELTVVYANRAAAWVKMGRPAEAIADCDKALRQAPRLVRPYLVRGSAHAQQGDYAAARADFSAAIELEQNNSQPYALRGLAAIQAGHPSAAVADLTASLRLDPSQAMTFALRGFAHRRIGQQERALGDFLEAFLLDPRYLTAYCKQKGRVHALRGEYAEAAAVFTIASTVEPENANALARRKKALQLYRAHGSQPLASPNRGTAQETKKAAPPTQVLRAAQETGSMVAVPTTEHNLTAAELEQPSSESGETTEFTLSDDALGVTPNDAPGPPSSDTFELSDTPPSEAQAEAEAEARRAREAELARQREEVRKLAEERRRQQQLEELRQKSKVAGSDGGYDGRHFWWRIGVAATVAAVLLGLVGGGMYYAGFVGEAKLTAADIWQEFAQDNTEANNKYEGQFLQLSGTMKVERINGRERYFFEAQGDATWSIECAFPKDMADQAKAIQTGQEAIIRGRCNRRPGPDGNLLLTSCEIVKLS